MTMSSISSSPPKKKLCALPLDLTRRDSVKTPSVYSDGTNSPPSDHSPIHPFGLSSTHFGHSFNYKYPESLQDALPSDTNVKRETPGATYFDTNHCQPSSYMIEALALQKRLSDMTQLTKDEETSGRPFKDFPKNPQNLPFLASADGKYQMYRMEMLEKLHSSRGGQPTTTNPKMRRVYTPEPKIIAANGEASVNLSDSSINSGVMDSTYYERRQKNNAAAKRSRDRRKIKEDEIAIRAKFLENRNRELKVELEQVRQDSAALQLELALVRKQLPIHFATDGVVNE